MFRRLFSKTKPAPLTGAPVVRRQKAYSAQSGYVYQYFYEGQRPYEQRGDTGTEFVFDVSADRKTSTPLSVFVGERALAPWQSEHQRQLTSTERYAIAKLALFQKFDESENPVRAGEAVTVDAAQVNACLATLRID